MAVTSREGHVPDPFPRSKDITLFAPIILPSAETLKMGTVMPQHCQFWREIKLKGVNTVHDRLLVSGNEHRLGLRCGQNSQRPPTFSVSSCGSITSDFLPDTS